MPFVLLHMVLLMHSAVVKTPKTQPFHATLACKRHVACLVGDANASELSAVSKALVISLRCITVVAWMQGWF